MISRENYLKNIRKNIDDLYINENYYLSIPSGKFNNQEYWNIQEDPDGKRRDRLTERSSFLEDIKYLTTYVNNLDSGRILDIGCGPGWFLSSLHNSWDKFGIEPVLEVTKFMDENINVVNDSIENSTFEENFFDLIIMHHSIEHISNPLKVLNECKKILKNGGLIIIGTPDFDSGMARRYNDKYRLLNDPTHVSLFTNESMHRFLRDNNFKIQKVEYPYFETKYFSKENINKLFTKDIISPPFYGSFMTFFAVLNK